MIGKTLGHYQITEKLGEGGMGVVYKARDTHLDRFAALKILPPEKVADAERKRRFVREAKAASALNHPNIVHVYDIDQSDGTDYIAMEHVDGKTLDQRIGRHGLHLNDALKFAVQIADALAKAHSAGIVHRDLKPTNIMVNEDGAVKVLDFGLAKLTELVQGDETASTATIDDEGRPITEEGVIVGTVAYMSPEQAEGKKVDARSDIFSLGSVLYEMVTGQKAFQGTSKLSTLSAILHQEPKPVSGITPATPTDLEKLINRCLRKDPAKRWQTMADVKVALDELKEDSDSARLQAAPAKTRQVTPMRLVVVAAAVVVLAAAGWYWLSRQRVTEPETILTPVPLTSYPGTEDEPTLSPDGSQVAFTWGGEEGENTDIWVKVIGAELPLRLTSNPARDFSPAWSPDGRWIAFCRDLPGQKTALILIPPIGGQERILAENLSHRAAVRGPFLAWMPDSRSLVIASRDNIEENLFLLSIETREMRRLTTGAEDSLPAVSPDGTRLAFCRWTSWANSDLYLMELSGKLGQRPEPRRLTFEYASAVWSAWSADSRALIFSVRKAGVESNLFRVDLSGTGRPQRLAAPARFCSNPVVSRQGNRLVYVQRTEKWDIWRMDIPSPHEKAKPPTKFISTSRSNVAPRFSPDGKSLAFTSDRSGTRQIWVSNSDGSNPVQLTSLGKGTFGWFLPWSPDSSRLAFYGHVEGRREVYVINANGGTPRRLTTTPSEYTMGSANASWSRDGRWILFDRAGGQGSEICRIPAEGGAAVPLIKNEWSPLESPDGKFIYYFEGDPNVAPGLWRVPKEGGEAQQVLDNINDNENYDFVGNEIYFIPKPDAASKYSIECLDTTTGKIRRIATFDHRIYTLTVSPDRRWILWSEEESDSDLMLVENFR